MSVFITQAIDEYGETTYTPTLLGYTVLVFVLVFILLLISLITKSEKTFNVKALAFSSIAIALSFVLSYIKLFRLPFGGSVTLCSMLFISMIGYFYGIKTGVFAGIAYGLLQLMIDPYIISVPQMLCDYILAFGAMGLSGIYSKMNSKYSYIPAYLTSVAARLFFSVLSGIIFFGAYAPDSFNSTFLYSLCYNGLYMGAEAVITVAIILIPPVRKGLVKIHKMSSDYTA